MKLFIFRAKPNPAGKDLTAWGSPKAEQLLAEWVDLKNISESTIRLSEIGLCHTEFSQDCVPHDRPTVYWNGRAGEELQPGEIVRVHTGKSRDAYCMRDEDQQGVHHHAFAESGSFVLNNKCGDILSVWRKDSDGKWSEKLDGASYDPNPPDGEVLERSGNKLVPSYALI